MMDWDNGRMDASWGIVMMLSMVILWVLVAVAVVWFVRLNRSDHALTAPGPGAMATRAEHILAERLARGEIDAEDYQGRLTALRTPRS